MGLNLMDWKIKETVKGLKNDEIKKTLKMLMTTSSSRLSVRCHLLKQMMPHWHSWQPSMISATSPHEMASSLCHMVTHITSHVSA